MYRSSQSPDKELHRGDVNPRSGARDRSLEILRQAGAGPLALLYLAWLANALVAVALLTWAVRLMPIAPEAMMAAALLPMALFEYASAAPDAGVIGTTFLFTAIALHTLLRGGWTAGEVAVAAVSGLVFSSQKPVYAPLLVLGVPTVLTGGRVKQTLLAQAAVLLVALGGTAFWLLRFDKTRRRWDPLKTPRECGAGAHGWRFSRF